MTDELHIRPARADELDELSEMAVSAGSPDAADGQLTVVHRAGRLLAVELGGRAVGVAGSLPVAGATFVSDLFVSPDARGRGVGRALLEALLADAGECLVFSSHHPAARHLYECRGLRPLGRLLYLERTGQRRYVPDHAVAHVDDLVGSGWVVVDDDIVMATQGWTWPEGLLEASPGRFWPDGDEGAEGVGSEQT